VIYVLYVLYMCTIRIPRIPRTTSCDPSCDFAYHSSSHGSIGSIVAHATSTNSLSSALSSCDTYLIRFVTYIKVFKLLAYLSTKAYIAVLPKSLYTYNFLLLKKPFYFKATVFYKISIEFLFRLL